MLITIETDGDSNGTSISLNGRKQKLVEFVFSVRALKKAKLQMKVVDPSTREVQFLSYFGDDFLKFNERASQEEVEGYVGRGKDPVVTAKSSFGGGSEKH